MNKIQNNAYIKSFVSFNTSFISQAIRYALWCFAIRPFRKTITVTTPQGIFTVSTKDEGIGAPLWVKKQHEYEYSLAAVHLLRDRGYLCAGATMLDVGANIGTIGIGLVSAGLVKRVIAIEPDKHNYDLLQTNVKANQLESSIECIQQAAGEKDGVLRMALSEDNHGDHHVSDAGTVEVPARTLNGFTTTSLVWIDVQGYEGYVFRGSKQLLQTIPVVSEIWPEGIRRAGMATEDFCKIASTIWTHYWVERRGHFVKYPINVLDCYIAEIEIHDEHGNCHENIIFTKD